ncbi:MAG: UDP-N-acetylmuramoyl-L-alanine--D-glutamate ligase, partial [Deltaproteobacteria bacterium]|nr:UDP-N-acetylmuramoyl-L-alanine--D-glutamate ligase [Deltaproteobacteria bacterium]
MVELQIETASDLAGRRVVVVGLARTGLAVAEFLLSQGSEVVATDILPAERLDEQIKTLATRGAVLELGGHQNETFLEADLIVVSPGVPPTIQPLQMALAKGVPVIGELEFASFYVTAPLIAVTGTNGKSTTTALIGEILQAAGRRVFVGGNIGNPLMNAVNSREKFDLAVVEVSSFQLEGVESFHPKVALHLNLTPDHLDRHVHFSAYAEAKARLFSRQTTDDTAILNADDDQVAAIRTRARRLMFSRRHELGNGAFIKEGKIVLAQGGRPLGELPLEELSLTGSHNHENVMAALLAAWALGIETETTLEAAARFQGLPHRVEFIGRYGGVRYYNDSKATNVGAVIRSVEGFS